MKQIYTALLKKNFNNNININEPIHIETGFTHWIALGHFDDIYTYNLTVDNGKLLDSINKDKHDILEKNTQKENLYYYPLYLIPYQKNTITISQHRFISIIRVHFKESIDIQSKFNLFEKQLDNIFNKTIQHRLFYATEFSDAVLELQCDNLCELTHCSFAIRKLHLNFIGKIYTYFGINLDFLKKVNENVDTNDSIDLFSMRFSGYHTDIMNEQIQLIDKHIKKSSSHSTYHCVNGIDDFLIEYHGVLTSDIISLYREWLLNDKFANIRMSVSSTKLGINLNNVNEWIENDSNLDEDTNSICKSLPTICKDIMGKAIEISLNAQGWLDSILEISYSLARMSKTPVMDEAAYLIAPGFQAFLYHIKDCLYSNIPINTDIMYNYTADCSYLIEQLLRAEGQLSHNPEIRPIIYKTPIFMLEYTLAFLNTASILLQHDDGNKEDHTLFFLVPCPCEKANALELFPPKNGTPGLVHIRIPENILDNPEDAFRTLCHEISHYVGETYRCRNARVEAYSWATASLLSDRVFDIKDKYFIKTWSDKFIQELKSNNIIKLHDMHDRIVYIIEKILYDDSNFIDTVITQYFTTCRYNKSFPQKMPEINAVQIQALYQEEFKKHINDIDLLFREIFADICMIYILNIDTNTYIESLLEELAKDKSKNDVVVEFRQEGFAIRIRSTLCALARPIIYTNEKYSSLWEKELKIINTIDDSIDNELQDWELRLSPTCNFYLLEYAKRCYRKINEALDNSNLKNIRNMYSMFSNNKSSYPDVLKVIEAYRENFFR